MLTINNKRKPVKIDKFISPKDITNLFVSVFLLLMKFQLKLANATLITISSEEDEFDSWKNPPEASPALKEIFKEFKHTFKSSDKWDGDFVL